MMKRKLILTGAALSLAVAMTGCGGNPVINQQPSSQAQEQAQLEEIDHVMLWYDLDGLLGEKQDGEPPKLHIELDYTVEPFAKVEAEYIRIFEKYSRSEK